MSYNTLLEEMAHWDKDKRFMGASDLTNEISSRNQPLEVGLQKRICQAFLKQLEDQSIEVQGNAVKCLAKIVGVLTSVVVPPHQLRCSRFSPPHLAHISSVVQLTTTTYYYPANRHSSPKKLFTPPPDL